MFSDTISNTPISGFGFQGSLDEYVDMAKAGKQIYGPQTAWSLGWWENKHHGDMMFVYYEDMAEGPAGRCWLS